MTERESHRAAAGRRRASDADAVAAIDIGASKVACVIGRPLPGEGPSAEAEVLGLGHAGVRPGPTPGAGPSPRETALRAALESAERMAGLRVRVAHVAVAGRALAARRLGVDLELGHGAVTAEDVAECLAEAARAAAAPGIAPLSAEAPRFAVDGEPCDGRPEGAAGAVLTAEVLALGLRDSAATNISALVERCGLELARLHPAPLAAAEAAAIDDEKDLGVLVLDLGARATGFAVYERGGPLACGAVGVGGEHVSRDVAQLFGAPLADAERLKTLFGSTLAAPGDEQRLIDVPQLGDPSDVERRSRADLAAVIAPRFEETLSLVLAAAEERAGGRSVIRRAVLTGGGSLLLGARETAEATLGVRARLGRPALLAGAPEAAGAPQFAVAMGVLMRAAAGRRDAARRSPLWSPPARARAAGALGGVGAWLRANF